MVIQRWQSVLLFFAAVAMAVFAFIPIASVASPDGTESLWRPIQSMPVFIVSIVTALLLIVDIFLYRNLDLQIKVALLGAILIIVDLGLVALSWYLLVVDGLTMTSWPMSATLVVLAFFITMIARGRMIADRKLLRSYDRLR